MYNTKMDTLFKISKNGKHLILKDYYSVSQIKRT